MNRIFNRYIIKYVLTATFAVLGVMLALTLFTTLLGEFQDIGRGEYNFVQALIYVTLRLPHNLYLFSPMLILLGGIIGLGMLNAHQELMVIRSSGFSVRAIMLAMTYSALIIVSIVMGVGEGLAPQLDHKASIRKQNAENNGQVVATVSGIWLHEGSNFFHIDHVIGKRHLEGVTRYQFNGDHQLIAAFHAKTMDYEHDRWQLRQIVKTEFLQQGGTQTSYEEQTVWQFTLNPSLFNIGILEPEEMSLSYLNSFTRHLSESGLQVGQYKLAFWQRVLQPFSILIMLFLAVPFVLTTPRGTSLGLRILLGIVSGFVFYLSNAFLGQLSVIFQFPALLAAVIPIILFSIISFGALRRLR